MSRRVTSHEPQVTAAPNAVLPYRATRLRKPYAQSESSVIARLQKPRTSGGALQVWGSAQPKGAR
ncbi:MAG: hypothetical protein WBP03_02085 [Candidatus Saccharimonadales bacterium]